MLDVIDLVHYLPGQTAGAPLLDHLCCHIKSGESVAIVGASGVGKTTLLSFLAGLDTPAAGKVLIDGQDIMPMSEEQRAALRAAKVAFVFQNFQLIDGLTALQNVCLPMEVKGIAQPEAQAKVWLHKVGLEHRLSHKPSALSGGEQQRVAVARAFACDAPLLFADEPTGSLDIHTGKAVADLLFDLCQQKRQTLVLVTHDERLAARCDRVLRLEGGQLKEQALEGVGDER
ncbi:MAG TPA: ABC transporter ATP-binding protein [Marinagarivorans sp.]